MKTTKRKREAKPVQASVETPAENAAAFTLSSTCTIKDATSLKGELCKLAAEDRELIIDVSQLQRIDTASMQLLCALVRDRNEKNGKTTWRGDAPAWQEAVRLLGVGHLLGLTGG